MLSATDIEILHDALSCLDEYWSYGKSMQAIGRGFHPVGRHGHSIENVISNLRHVITKHEIPELRPIANRPVKLDKDAWK